MDVFLARMVMPRSRSSAFESMTRSATCWFSRKIWLCFSIASTSVVLPWSTWATMAMFRISLRCMRLLPYKGLAATLACLCLHGREPRRPFRAISDGCFVEVTHTRAPRTTTYYTRFCGFLLLDAFEGFEIVVTLNILNALSVAIAGWAGR